MPSDRDIRRERDRARAAATNILTGPMTPVPSVNPDEKKVGAVLIYIDVEKIRASTPTLSDKLLSELLEWWVVPLIDRMRRDIMPGGKWGGEFYAGEVPDTSPDHKNLYAYWTLLPKENP